MLFVWLLSNKRFTAIAIVFLAGVMAVGLFPIGNASAQTEGDELAGLPVSVENTFASDVLTGGDEIVFGTSGPTKIDGAVEFANCCDDSYDIDIASDRITMTWVGDDELARVIEPGTYDRYRFTVVGATFAEAVADTEQKLVPDVTFFANTISVKVGEGSKVGPGQDAVILITPVVRADRNEATAADAQGVALAEAAPAEGTNAAAAEFETLPRTGETTEAIAAVGLLLVALGLITYGVGNRARRIELL